MIRTRLMTGLTLAAAVAAATFISPIADATTWHKVRIPASTGTVDEADMDEVRFASARAGFRNSVDSGKITLRYYVNPYNGSSDLTLDAIHIGLRWKDNGSDARVVAKLKGYHVSNGTTITLLTFDSDTELQSGNHQFGWASDHSPAAWNSAYAYFIEVTLTKNSSAGRPELGSVDLWLLES